MKYLIKNLFILGMIAIPSVTKGQMDTCHCSLLKFYKSKGAGTMGLAEKREIKDSLVMYETVSTLEDSFNNIHIGNAPIDTLIRRGTNFFYNGFVVFSPDSFQQGKSTSKVKFYKDRSELIVWVYKPTGKIERTKSKLFCACYTVERHRKWGVDSFSKDDISNLDLKTFTLEYTYSIKFNPFYGEIEAKFDNGLLLDLDHYISMGSGCYRIRSYLQEKWFDSRK